MHGSLAQLNRASDYGSEGYRFESCRSHKTIDGSLAQLNRASDYGSDGYRFESCRSHKRRVTLLSNPSFVMIPISSIRTVHDENAAKEFHQLLDGQNHPQ